MYQALLLAIEPISVECTDIDTLIRQLGQLLLVNPTRLEFLGVTQASFQPQTMSLIGDLDCFFDAIAVLIQATFCIFENGDFENTTIFAVALNAVRSCRAALHVIRV